MNKVIDIIRSDKNNYLLLVVTSVAVIVATIVGRAPLWNALSFLLTQLFFIFIPGRAVTRLLFGLSFSKMIDDCLSYGMGYALSILIYLCFLIFNIQFYVLVLYIPIAILSVWYLYRTRRKPPYSERAYYNWFEKKWFAILLLISICIGVVLFECINLNPRLFSEGTNVTINQDLLFWLRNAIAASKAYPLPDLSVAGNQFFYHYFSSLEIAFLHCTSGIDNYNLCFVYSYLVTLFLFSSSIYVVAKKYIKNEGFVFFFMAIVLLTCSFESLTDSYYSHHIYKGSFGLAEGLSFFCFSLFLFKEIEKDDYRNPRVFAAFCLFFFTLVGLKAPIASLLLVGIGGKCIYDFLISPGNLRVVIFSIFILIVFAGVFVFIVSGNVFNQTIQYGSNMDMYPSITSTMLHSDYFALFYNFLIATKLPTFIIVPFALLVYCLLALFIPLLILTYSIKSTSIRGWSFVDNLEGAIVIVVGLCLCLFVGHKGMSQMYFLFPLIILIPLYSIAELSKNLAFAPTRKWLFPIFVLGFSLFMIQNGKYFYRGLMTLAETTFLKDTEYHFGYNNYNGRSLTAKEVEGLQWVKENTQSNGVLITNKIFSVDKSDKYRLDSLMFIRCNEDNYVSLSEQLLSIHASRSTVASSFSERQLFMEGYYFSNMDPNETNRRAIDIYDFFCKDDNSSKVLKKNGVTHAVVFKSITPNEYPEGCNVLFENEKILIVKL